MVEVHERLASETTGERAAYHRGEAARLRVEIATRSEAAPMVKLALEIASRAHRGQVDKAGRPYIEHPLAVMAMLEADDTIGRVVAVLHDVIEDSEITASDLRARGIGEEAVAGVEVLTHARGEPNAVYWARVRAHQLALRVKLADLEHNSDPERLAALDAATRRRLEAKYSAARAALLAPRRGGEEGGSLAQ